jgi:hypothetical protein
VAVTITTTKHNTRSQRGFCWWSYHGVVQKTKGSDAVHDETRKISSRRSLKDCGRSTAASVPVTTLQQGAGIVHHEFLRGRLWPRYGNVVAANPTEIRGHGLHGKTVTWRSALWIQRRGESHMVDERSSREQQQVVGLTTAGATETVVVGTKGRTRVQR